MAVTRKRYSLISSVVRMYAPRALAVSFRHPVVHAPGIELCVESSAVALFLVSLTALLRAQSTNASLTGRVTDPSQALIADAKIAAISAGTNVRYETTTNGSGEYHLANLPPAPIASKSKSPASRS